MEKQENLAVGYADLLNEKLFENAPEIHHHKKILDHRAVRSVTVLDLTLEILELRRIAQARQALVEVEPLIGVVNIGVRKISRYAQADFRLHLGRHLLALELLHRLLHHLGIQLESDGGDLAGLLLAQKISRAANFQIVQRQLESASQPVQLLERAQPF